MLTLFVFACEVVSVEPAFFIEIGSGHFTFFDVSGSTHGAVFREVFNFVALFIEYRFSHLLLPLDVADQFQAHF